MNQGKYVFSQLMEFVPYYQFNQCVEKYKGHFRTKSLTCWDQFLAMAFGKAAMSQWFNSPPLVGMASEIL